MPNIDYTAVTPVLKELIAGQKVEMEIYKNNPFFALMPKNPNGGGKYYPNPVQIGAGQGRSSTFSNAQANISPDVYKEFLVTYAKDYGIGRIDNQVILGAKNDKQAFVNAVKRMVDSATQNIKNSLSSSLFRSGTGSIGQIGSITTGVIVLASPLDVVQFEINQKVQAAATDGAAPRAATGYVISVDRSAGTVTVSTTYGGAAGSPASWAANDFLLTDGDSNAKITGLAGWIPFTAPSATAFFGVDRTSDNVRLAGNRKDATNQPIEEGLQDFLTQIALNGGQPDFFITNPNSYTALQKSMGSKAQIVQLAVDFGKEYKATVGFSALEVQMSGMTVKVLQDRNCPALFGYALQMNTWEFVSLGEAPSILTYGSEGLEMLRVYNEDSAELRMAYYGNTVCSAPAYNGVIKMSN